MRKLQDSRKIVNCKADNVSLGSQESHAIQEQEARDHPPAPAVPRFDEDHVAAKGTEDELDTIAKMARMRAYL